MTSACLIVVDLQHGFINEWTRHLPAAVEAVQNDYQHVIVTRFLNPPGSAHRRLLNWTRFAPGSWDVELAFQPRDGTPVINKTGYGCMTPEVRALLDQWHPDEVHLAGIATDNCILKTAVDLFEAGFTPVVLTALCASHGGQDLHDCAVRILKRFIGEAQVR